MKKRIERKYAKKERKNEWMNEEKERKHKKKERMNE